MIEGNALIFSADSPEIEQLVKGQNEFLLLSKLKQDKGINSLCFSACRLNDAALKIIINLVKKCKQIDTLDISDNYFTTSGIDLLSNQLSGTNLKTLNVCGNYHASTDAFVRLSAVIKDTNILRLNLSRLPLELATILIIKNLQGSKVVDLNLSTVMMGADAAQEVSHFLEGTLIKHLDVSSNNLQDQGAEHLVRVATRNKMHKLNIGYNQLSGEFISTLAKIVFDSTLTTIDYDGTILLAQFLKEMKISESLNQEQNNPAQLSQSFLNGYNLRLLEQGIGISLPAELNIAIARQASNTKTQISAFHKGWRSADMGYSLKPT